MSSSAGPSRLLVSRSNINATSHSTEASISPTDSSSVKSSVRLPNDLVPFMRRLTDLLDVSTSNANALPPKSDLSFHRTLDRKFAKDQDEAGDRLLKLADRLLGAVHSGSSSNKGKGRRQLDDEDDVVDGYRRGVLDAVNGLLEDAASNLDDVSGAKKVPVIDVKQSVRGKGRRPYPTADSLAESIPKPQDKFSPRYHLALQRQDAFRPDLTTKPHALIPFELREVEHRRDIPDGTGANTGEEDDDKLPRRRTYEHPYRYETEHLGYPTSMFTHSPPIQSSPLLEQKATLVDSPAAYKAMVEELLQAKEIAVDLEHHHIRSYLGFTCLMQISTRQKDWIVDAIKLRDLLHDDKLGGVMADPSIIKVLQGADQDITWLQKDFQIYIVNLFDTHQAAVYLGYPQRSLKALVSRICGVRLDKTMQLADWRVRPLTAEMLLYATADTHFLLCVYDQLRNELLDKSRHPSPSDNDSMAIENPTPPNPQGTMRTVLERSERIALKVYEREWADPDSGRGPNGWYNGLSQSLGLGKLQTEVGMVFIALHTWRDTTARKQDEAPQYIMSNGSLRRLSLAAAASSDVSGLVTRLPEMYRKEVVLQLENAKLRWREHEPMILSGAPGVQSSSRSPSAHISSPAPPNPETQPRMPEPGEETDLWGASKGMDLQFSAAEFATTSELFDRSLRKQTEHRPSKLTQGVATSELFGSFAGPDTTTAPPFDYGGSSTTSDLFGSLPFAKRTDLPSEFAAVKAAIDRAVGEEGTQTTGEAPAQSTEASNEPSATTAGIFGQTTTDGNGPANPEETSSRLDAHPGTQAKIEAADASSDDAFSAGEIDEETGESVVRVNGIGRRRKGSSGKERKAKRAKRSKKGKTSLDSGVESSHGRSDVADFDYSFVPSLLDAPPTTTKSEKRKRQKGKGGGVTTETFGQIAKDPSQPKGGNKSMTFG